MKKVERHRYKDKKIIQTRTLIFEPYSYDEIDTVIEKIQDNLSSDLFFNHTRQQIKNVNLQ